MPYISYADRVPLKNRTTRPMYPGQLNFLITQEIMDYLHRLQHRRGEFKLLGYSDFNEVIGVLDCIKMELYRRKLAPYEDLKIEENGDIF